MNFPENEGPSLPNTRTAHPSRTITAPPSFLFSRGAWLCAALLAICLFAVLPFAEIGVHDDWSYIYTALTFARTGHVVYNGWATAMLGWQIVWGALFAKAFGPSFTAVRLSMIPVALACAVLLHALLRRFGLNAVLATFGTLTLCLSPLFLNLGDSFMSDVPGLFSILLCLYLCQRALASSDDRAALLWLAAAALSNVLTGTARQIAWLGALVAVPSCGWLLRKRRHAIATTVSLWLASVALIWLCMHWFASQPYSVPEKLLPGRITLNVLLTAMDQFFRAGLSTPLFCLPVLVSGLAFVPRLRSRTRRVALIWLLALLSIVAVLKLTGQLGPWLPFWMNDIVTAKGILPLNYGFGIALPSLSVHLLDLLLLVLALSCISYGVLLRQEWSKRCESSSPQDSLSRHDTLVLLLPFLIAYCALLAPRAGFSAVYDRYLLPVLVVVLYFLLRAYQDHIASRLPAVAYIVLVAIAVLSVAGNHDRFAGARASVRLLDRLQASGVKRTDLYGGFEFDGWTQIETAGYINDPHIVNFPGPPASSPRPYDPRDPCSVQFASGTPVVRPKYFITQGLSSCFNSGPLMSDSYRTWLPPATRSLYIQSTTTSSPAGGPSPHNRTGSSRIPYR